MNTRLFKQNLPLFLFVIFGCRDLIAQNQVTKDSLTRELQEIIVTTKQPVTKLIGSTLISIIPGSNLADLGTALDVLAQLPMIKVEDNMVNVIGKSNI